jgi:hypothetical protein
VYGNFHRLVNCQLRLLGVESGDVELLGDKKEIEAESIETSSFEGSGSNSGSNRISPSKIRREKQKGAAVLLVTKVYENSHTPVE